MKRYKFILYVFIGLLGMFAISCSSSDNGLDEDGNLYGKAHTYQFVINGGGYANQEFKGEIENKFYEDDMMDQSASAIFYNGGDNPFINIIISDDQKLLITAAFIMSGDNAVQPLGDEEPSNSTMYFIINNAGGPDTESYGSVSGDVLLKHLEVKNKGASVSDAAVKVDFEGIFEGGLLLENEEEPVQIKGSIQIHPRPEL